MGALYCIGAGVPRGVSWQMMKMPGGVEAGRLKRRFGLIGRGEAMRLGVVAAGQGRAGMEDEAGDIVERGAALQIAQHHVEVGGIDPPPPRPGAGRR